jgi:hypothetical protein
MAALFSAAAARTLEEQLPGHWKDYRIVKEIVGAQGGLLVCSSLEMSSPLTCDPEPSERFLVQSVLDFQGFASASSSFLFRSETLLSLLISFLPTIILFSVRVTHTHTHTHTFSFGNSSFFAYLFPSNNYTIFRSSYHLSSDLCFFFFFFMAACHCRSWWRWWSVTLWATLMRLWLHSLSCYL